MNWPWKKREPEEDPSWEALHESAVQLNNVKNQWPAIRKIANDANEVADGTRRRREQNGFPELLQAILYGGPR